jgi:integrase
VICFVFKRKGRRLWRGRFQIDGQPKIIEVPLRCSDKQVAEKKLKEMVRLEEQEAAGIIPSKQIRDAAQKPLSKHLEEFVADLEKSGCSEKHLANVRHRVGQLVKDCAWLQPSDATADSLTAWRSRQHLAAKTLNDYLGAISSLLNWMKNKGRILDNPLASMQPIEIRGCQTRVRRAFTDDEMRRLVAVAGPRKAIYLMAVHTGLRRSEVAGLQWGDVLLDAVVPFAKVRASTTKNGKSATIRLHSDVVAALQELAPPVAAPAEQVFQRMPRIERFRRDLKKAGIAYKDAQGRVADFHSLRKTFCTNLARGGIPGRTAMALMRHSDRRLTDKIYTDENLLDTAAAIECLPSFSNSGPQLGPQELGAASHGVTRPDTARGEGVAGEDPAKQ